MTIHQNVKEIFTDTTNPLNPRNLAVWKLILRNTTTQEEQLKILEEVSNDPQNSITTLWYIALDNYGEARTLTKNVIEYYLKFRHNIVDEYNITRTNQRIAYCLVSSSDNDAFMKAINNPKATFNDLKIYVQLHLEHNARTNNTQIPKPRPE